LKEQEDEKDDRPGERLLLKFRLTKSRKRRRIFQQHLEQFICALINRKPFV
jgi:hypothetical protein